MMDDRSPSMRIVDDEDEPEVTPPAGPQEPAEDAGEQAFWEIFYNEAYGEGSAK